ncbi:DUF2129 domain-containing protein, partial [Lactobacillus sp. XV13L]|nr:DUF2129 domain-containing protein [Lactobacillus sp. XV13L]
LYVDQDQAEQTVTRLSGLDFVKGVEQSSGDQIDLSSGHIEQQIADMAQEAEEKLLENQEKNTDIS